MDFSKAKGLFFDREKVKRCADAATRRVFSKFGAFVRQTAKSSIRKRRRVSAPGESPTSRTGTLKRFVFFGYDPGRRSVVIGPTRLAGKIGDAPHALEHGGPSEMVAGRRRRKRRMQIAARPYMGPAMQKELPRVPAMWRDSIK